MPEQRPFKLIRFRHDAVCRSCSGDIKAGAFALWAPGNITWHSDCEAPNDALNAPWEPDPNGLDRWCERKAEESHQEYMARKAERNRGTGGPANAGAGATVDAPTTHPAALTSDARHQETF